MWGSTDEVTAGNKKKYSELGKVGISSLRVWDPKSPPSSWLEKMNDMAGNREQWRLCGHFLLKSD